MSRPPTMEPWARLDEESERAWTAFSAYLRLDKPRTLDKLAATGVEKRRALKTFYEKHGWKARAAAWDEEQARVERQAILAEREKIAREHIRAASLMRQVGAAELQRRAAQIARRHKQDPSSDATYISDRDAVTMLKTGIEMERALIAEAAAREPATEAGEAMSVDLSRLTPEEAEQLKGLLEKAGAIA